MDKNEGSHNNDRSYESFYSDERDHTYDSFKDIDDQPSFKSPDAAEEEKQPPMETHQKSVEFSHSSKD